MKQVLKLSFKELLGDRTLLFLVLAIAVMTATYMLYVTLSLQVSDLQLSTRFTSFGETHFYRTKWYYLINFIAFGLIFAVIHIGSIIKLHMNEMRSLAIVLGWASIALLILIFLYTRNVLGIAYLA